MKKHKLLISWSFMMILTLTAGQIALGQDVAVLKYEGGGDWYANPTALPNEHTDR